MRQLSAAGQRAINDLAQRHGFSSDAVLSMLESVVNGNGAMAQFSHPNRRLRPVDAGWHDHGVRHVQ